MFGQPSGTTEQTHVGPTHKSTGEDPEITNRAALTSVIATAAVLAAVGVGSQIGAEGTDQTPPARTEAGPAAAGAPRPIVVVISVDGLNPAAIRILGTRARAFGRLAREGSSSLNARTSVELTRTLPNHTGMLTGRRIFGRTGTHVTFNEDNGRTLRAINGYYVPGMFDVAHDHGMRTALLAEKDKFRFLIRSWSAAKGARDQIGPDDGRDKIDLARIAGASTLTRTLRSALVATDPPRLAFLHLAGPDLAGHAHGFMSRRYLDAVATADARIGTVLHTIASRPRLAARTTVLVTSDHGGSGAHHGDPARLANYRIPFYAWGVGVRRGGNLYGLNPGRSNPGSARPGYSGPQPVRNLDVADLALSLLGLPTLPGTPPNEKAPLRVG